MKLGARFRGSVGLSQLDRDYFATVSGDISQFGGSPFNEQIVGRDQVGEHCES